MTVTLFKLTLFIHVASVVIGMGTAVFFHIQFLRRGLRWGALQQFFHVGSRVIWLGLAGAIVTGILLWAQLSIPRPPLFYGKLALVAMLFIDGTVIHFIGKPRLNLLRPDQGFRDLSADQRRLFYVSGAVSFLGWWGALFLAYMI